MLTGHCDPALNLKGRAARSQGMYTAVGTPGRFSKFLHVTGDMRYGAVMEFVDAAGTFFATGFDAMSIVELKSGLVSRNTDYWDSWQLTADDLESRGPQTVPGSPFRPAGPTRDVVVVRPFSPVHPDGKPRFLAACSPNSIPSDAAHASLKMQRMAKSVLEAVSAADGASLAALLSEDCLLVHPLLHTGNPGYATFNRGIQMRGKKRIEGFFRAVLPLSPDGRGSTLLNVVGGDVGGGFEWKAGGQYSAQGLQRDGIRGATAIDIVGDRICRFSVKFDSYHVDANQRARIDRAIAAFCR